jgi:hypothetical protein
MQGSYVNGNGKEEISIPQWRWWWQWRRCKHGASKARVGGGWHGARPAPSEVQNKMTFMRHQILSCHVSVVRSFFILWKMLLSSQNLPYDHLLTCDNIIFQYPKK